MPQLKLPIDPSDVLGAVKAGADLAAAPAELLILADPEVADSVRQMLVGGESLERASEHAVASVATSVTLPPATSPETVVLVVIPAEGEAQLREGLRRASWPGGGVVAVLGDKRDSLPSPGTQIGWLGWGGDGRFLGPGVGGFGLGGRAAGHTVGPGVSYAASGGGASSQRTPLCRTPPWGPSFSYRARTWR